MFPLILADMGLGITLPLLLSTLFGGMSLLRNLGSSRVQRQSTEPGTLPGTGQTFTPSPGQPSLLEEIPAVHMSPYRTELMDLYEELGGYSPQALSYAGQLAENERIRGRRRGLYDYFTEKAETGPLAKLAGEVGTFRSDALERLDAQHAQAEAARGRGLATTAKGEEIAGRARELGEETQGYFRGVRENPDIFSDKELTQMAAEFAESQHAGSARDIGVLEERAARQGISPGALAALETMVKQGETGRLTEFQRDIDIQNAIQSAARGDQAGTLLEQLGESALNLESNIGLGYGTLAEQQTGRGDALDQWINQMRISAGNQLFGTEGMLLAPVEERVWNLQDKTAALEQPENLFLVGGLLDEINRYNVALKSGALGQESEAYGSMYNSLMSLLDSSLQREAMSDLAGSQTGSFAGLGSGLGSLAGLGTAALFPGPLTPLAALTGMGVGTSLGGGIGGVF